MERVQFFQPGSPIVPILYSIYPISNLIPVLGSVFSPNNSCLVQGEGQRVLLDEGEESQFSLLLQNTILPLCLSAINIKLLQITRETGKCSLLSAKLYTCVGT